MTIVSSHQDLLSSLCIRFFWVGGGLVWLVGLFFSLRGRFVVFVVVVCFGGRVE